MIDHLDLPSRIHDAEAVSHGLQDRLELVSLLSQLGLAGLLELRIEVPHLFRRKGKRSFQQRTALIRFQIALADSFQDFTPDLRCRWWVVLIETHTLQLSCQQRMHGQSGRLTQCRQRHRLVVKITRTRGIGRNFPVRVESNLLGSLREHLQRGFRLFFCPLSQD